MEKVFYNSAGAFKRQLSDQEVQDFASDGDEVAKRELLINELKAATKVTQLKDALIKFYSP